MAIRTAVLPVLLGLLGGAQGEPQEPVEACQVTLTASKPKAACTVPRDLVARPPRVVQIPVTKIENPSRQSFSIYLYVSAASGEPELIGNVTVFPPDRTGVYVIRSQAPFERLGASRPPARLAIEMRRTLESQPWRNVSVSIGPLRWLYSEPE
jgi:hypothetical protein